MQKRENFDENTRKKCRLLMKNFYRNRNNIENVNDACTKIMSIHQELKIKDINVKISIINKKIGEINNSNEEKKMKNERFTLKIPDKSFMNLTNLEVPQNVKTYIAMGPKFIPPMEDIPISELILNMVQIENICIDNNVLPNIDFKRNLCKKISKNLDRNMKYMEKHIIKIKREHQNYMRKYKDEIIVVQTDKGNISTLMEKKIYFEKMDLLIKKGIENNTYIKIGRDCDEIHQFMLRLRDVRLLNWIESVKHSKEKKIIELIKNVKNENVSFSRLYGNIKVHKEEMPMRPIMSTINSYSRVISEYIKETLKNIEFDYNINTKNSTEAHKEIKDIKILEGYRLMKLDVVDMFTNIPVQEVLRIIEINYRVKIEPITKVSFEVYYQLLTFVFKDDMFFRYNKDTYKQLRGLPMGSCVSQIAAQIYMDHRINENREIIRNLDITYMKKYVDDIIIYGPMKNYSRIKTKFEMITNLKFTIEIEEDNSIEFLDFKIINVGNNIKTCWYKKEMASERLLNFWSNHSLEIKNATINEHIRKVITFTHVEYIKEQIDKLYNRLNMNNYSDNYITKRIRQVLNEKKDLEEEKYELIFNHIKNKFNKHNFVKEKKEKCNRINMGMVVTPFVNNVSDKIKKVCKNNKLNIRLIYKNSVKNNTTTNMKEKKKREDSTGKIFMIKCNECEHFFILCARENNIT